MRTTMLWRCLLVIAIANCSVAIHAADAPTIDVGQPTSLVLEPAKFDLLGKRSRQQILVTGKYGEDLRDLTIAATFATSNPAVVIIDGSMVHPVGNGEATVTVTVGGQTATVPIVVKNMEAAAPVSFKTETQMALTKAGCNMGA